MTCRIFMYKLMWMYDYEWEEILDLLAELQIRPSDMWSWW